MMAQQHPVEPPVYGGLIQAAYDSETSTAVLTRVEKYRNALPVLSEMKLVFGLLLLLQ